MEIKFIFSFNRYYIKKMYKNTRLIFLNSPYVFVDKA